MKRDQLAIFSVSLLLVASSFAQTNKKEGLPSATISNPPLSSALGTNYILLLNAAEISSGDIEAVRSFAEKDLWVKVIARSVNATWSDLPATIPDYFSSTARAIVVFGKGPTQGPLFLTAPDNHWAIINVSALLLGVETIEVQRFLMQGAMRGIGFGLGLNICHDKHCVMRSITKTQDLKQAGVNFCGSTRQFYLNNALSIGLRTVSPFLLKKREQQRASKLNRPEPIKP